MDDQISRQAAIKIIKNYCENGCDIAEDNWCPSCQREQFIKLLEALPPAQQERKTGRWVFSSDGSVGRCNCCHYMIYGKLYQGNYLIVPYNYCPNCGAKMKGESDG